jgi:hypothetical protein
MYPMPIELNLNRSGGNREHVAFVYRPPIQFFGLGRDSRIHHRILMLRSPCARTSQMRCSLDRGSYGLTRLSIMADFSEKENTAPRQRTSFTPSEELCRRNKTKWAEDIGVIAEIVEQLEQQFALASLRLSLHEEAAELRCWRQLKLPVHWRECQST